jgi:hypothetical protein
MAKLNINIESHEQKYTVSDMRKRLAQVLSKLDGDQPVTFSFRAELTDYQPEPFFKMPYHTPTVKMGELARAEND